MAWLIVRQGTGWGGLRHHIALRCVQSSVFSVPFPYAWSSVSGCWYTEDCSWNPLLYTPSAFLILCSLLTAFFRSATCCRKSSTWIYLEQAGFLTVSATWQRHMHFLQPEVCPAATPFSSSVWKCQTALGLIEETPSLELQPLRRVSIMLSRQLLLNIAGPT